MTWALLGIGLAVGTLSGMVGVGGGVLLVPALHYLLKLSQHEAQGTSIAVLVPPIGIFAALEYYRHGYIRFPVVAWVALGFAVGALVGAIFAGQLSGPALRKFFGLFLLYLSLQMLFTSSQPRLQTVMPTALATGAVGVLSWVEQRLGVGLRVRRRIQRWIRRNKPPDQMDDIEYHI